LPDLVDRICAEIRERLDASRDAVQEYRRLEAALDALGPPTQASSGRGRRPTTPTARTLPRRPARSRGSRKRASRGANREAVLRVVRDRPGMTTGELAAASGVEKATLYTLLRTLTKQGVLQRQQLPGGQSGYRVREPDASAAAPAGDAAHNSKPETES
jgi:hypothetical protein